MIERSTKKKVNDKLIVREKLKSKANKANLRARTCTEIFVVFLKCTLEEGFGWF